MKIVKRLNRMYVVVENDLGDWSVKCDIGHPCYNEMWEWDRDDRRDYYSGEWGDHWDEQVLKYHKPKKKEGR